MAIERLDIGLFRPAQSLKPLFDCELVRELLHQLKY